MFKERKINKKRFFAGSIILSLIVFMFVAVPTTRGTHFYIASWELDSYGQGITTWYAQSNRTGSWVSIASANWLEAQEPPIPWNVSQAIRILVWAALNSTVVGVSDTVQGLNYLRHNITVVDQFNDVVFSQQNFTYYQNITGDPPDEEMYYYQHYVILDFLPLEGEFYTVTLLCEIYY